MILLPSGVINDDDDYTVLVSQPLHEFTRTSRFGWWMIITAASGCRCSERAEPI